MPQRIKFMCAVGAAALGTLCYVAAEPGFELVSERTAEFVGIAFFLLSGLFWTTFGFGARKQQ